MAHPSQQRGVVFYTVSSRSAVAPGMRDKVGFEGARANVETVCANLRLKYGLSQLTHDIVLKGQDGDALKPHDLLSNYNTVEVTILPASGSVGAYSADASEQVVNNLVNNLFQSTAHNRSAGDCDRDPHESDRLLNVSLLNFPVGAECVAATPSGVCLLCALPKWSGGVPYDGAMCANKCAALCCSNCYETAKSSWKANMCPVCALEVRSQEAPPLKRRRVTDA